jgi:hypothetical protein
MMGTTNITTYPQAAINVNLVQLDATVTPRRCAMKLNMLLSFEHVAIERS